jgi:hypothetical protein
MSVEKAEAVVASLESEARGVRTARHGTPRRSIQGGARRSIQGGECTADSGVDDKAVKVLTNWRGHNDVMQTRSIRGSGEPVWVIAL